MEAREIAAEFSSLPRNTLRRLKKIGDICAWQNSFRSTVSDQRHARTLRKSVSSSIPSSNQPSLRRSLQPRRTISTTKTSNNKSVGKSCPASIKSLVLWIPTNERCLRRWQHHLLKKVQAVFSQRTDAINALVAYCAEEEPLRTEVTEARKPSAPDELRQTHLSSDQQMDEIRKSTFASVVGEKNVRRCFLCVAKASLLGRNHSQFNDLCRNFYSGHNLAYHLMRTHLDGIPEGGRFECPLCHVTLLYKNHLRLHSHTIYGINTDRKREMQYNGK